MTRVYSHYDDECAELIRCGKLVAVPTETVYGLACDGLNAAAVERIYAVKGRPEIKPLSLMVASSADIASLCEAVPSQAYTVAEKFWPGPVTIVLRAKPVVPDIVRAGGSTVGLRCPKQNDTLSLIKNAHVPLAAPSANPSGAPSPKSAGAVLGYFDGIIDAVIDGGECALGLESTIIDMTQAPYKILRQGALPAEDIADALREGMCVIGLTGGSGCGKTTALNVLKSMGAMTIDCDEMYHELTRESDELRAALISRFGNVYSGRELKRRDLGQIVFSDPAALADLNAITHSFIHAELLRRLREHAMSGGSLAAIDAAALFAGGADKLCNATFGVIAPREMRIERIMAREGISREYAALRIDAQPDDKYFAERCTALLVNDRAVEDFTSACETEFRKVIGNGSEN